MANTITAQQANDFLKANNIQTGMSEAQSMAAINANPAIAAAWQKLTTAPPPVSIPTAPASTTSSAQPQASIIPWNRETATAVGQLSGILKPGQVATGGFLDSKVAELKKTDPAKAAEFERLALSIQQGTMSADALTNYFIDREAQKQSTDPEFGSLARAPYEKFTPYAEPAPEFKPFSLSDFMESPDYQFRLGEGQKAIDRAASARGNMFSGKALKDAARFGSNLAAGEFENAYNRYNTNFGIKQGVFTDAYNRYNQNFNTGYGQARTDSDTLFNRLATMSNAGSGMAGTAVNLGQNYAGNAGSIYGQQGSTAAAAAINRGNQQAQLFSDLFNYARK